MLTFAVDDPGQNYDNCYPLIYEDRALTEPNWLLLWLDHYSIEYNMIPVADASPGSWYTIGVNFWHFGYDYLQNLPGPVKEKMSKGSIRLLFIYREADDPRRIKQHIIDMCSRQGFDPALIWFISGNSQADEIENMRFFWYFDCNYFFQTQSSPRLQINAAPRGKNITCLARIHKHWREWFVYNLCRFADKSKNYISYGAVPTLDQDDFVLWKDDNRFVNYQLINIQSPDRAWRDSLPLLADDLDSDQHNQHSLIVADHFQNSYWNVVLETLLDTESKGGVFVTEKTLKPIRNGQSFLVLGCQYTLGFLRDRGYKTFSDIIDESYDEIESLHDRWYAVFVLARELSLSDQQHLMALQDRCIDIIAHNQDHFQRNRRAEIQMLAAYLDSI